jgi:HEAT repeat protein
VFLTLLRATRSMARWAGLLTVQGGAAIGRLALAEPDLDVASVSTVLIPLDVPSPFAEVVRTARPHVGAIASGDQGVDAMVLRMGGMMPPSAMILPIVLRERVVSLVVAHRMKFPLRLAHVTELLPLALAASEAIGRLIIKHKSAGFRAPTSVPITEVDPELVDTKKLPRTKAAWSAPAQAPEVPPVETRIEVSLTAEPPRAIDVVLDDVESDDVHTSADAISEAVERIGETLPALTRRFPGKLKVDRFAVTGRPLRAAQYGGLLELTVRLGTGSAELLIDKMGSSQRDVRFYATVCAAELRPRTAIFALAERLFDQDFGVRSSAIEALTGYPLGDLGHALTRTRQSVASKDPEVVAAATAALVALGDGDAVPSLIDAVERTDGGGVYARKALVALTAQDFGPNERKWRKWYDGARRRHRIEWLIDGLSHKDDAIRELAINDLRRVTGEYFGYHHDLPKRDRETAAARWAAWWKEAGLRRFVLKEDERLRPTAVLPARREP